MTDEIYEIIFFHDEIGINPTICKQPGFCSCVTDPHGVKCGYSVEEAQQKVVQYYEEKARWIQSLPPAAFLHSMGIYTDED